MTTTKDGMARSNSGPRFAACRAPGLFLVLGLACSRPQPPAIADQKPPAAVEAPAHSESTVAADGTPYGLRLEADTLSFCDQRGGRKLELKTGHDTTFDRPCVKDGEGNGACEVPNLGASVRTPDRGPDGILEFDGIAKSFPLHGRIHDCAADGKVVAVITGLQVVSIDVAKETQEQLSAQGGDRIAIDPGWIAWFEGAQVRAKRR